MQKSDFIPRNSCFVEAAPANQLQAITEKPRRSLSQDECSDRFGLDPANLSDRNWTLGCVSLKNKDVNEIYQFLESGSLVEIIP